MSGDASVPAACLPATPQVTVVVPTRNRSRLLAWTLRSVLRQGGVDLEVVVVDDASTDDSDAVVADLGDPRVRMVRQDVRRGVAAARNRGIAEASGEWVAFCDDDDLWAPDKLRLQLDAAHATGRHWGYTGSVNISHGGRVVGGRPPPQPEEVVAELPTSNVVPGGCSAVLASRRALEKTGSFDTRLQPLADWDLWLRLRRTGPPACVALPLVAYRVHARNMSLDTGRVEADFALIAPRAGRASRANLYRYLGWWSLRVRRRRAAATYFLRAALQREAGYSARLLMADLAYLLGDTAETLRVRFFPGVLRRPLQRPPPPEHPQWRACGQRWIDELGAS